jgi:acetyl-CoA carboxylase biotin carboxyl carrier protein
VNVDDIERLVRLVAETDLGELEIRHGGVHVRIARHAPAAAPAAAPQPQGSWGPPPSWGAPPPLPPPAGAAAAAPAPADEEAGLHVITSSMVGTFYRRPNPEAAPFVKEGDAVKKGQVICILEAMKILNEIESDVSGTVVRVHPEDGQPVEFGEKLFVIRPA